MSIFRYEIGAHILVRSRTGDENDEPIEVEILAKETHMIKARILSDGWFARGDIRWLHGDKWYSVCRVHDTQKN